MISHSFITLYDHIADCKLENARRKNKPYSFNAPHQSHRSITSTHASNKCPIKRLPIDHLQPQP